MLQKVVLRIIKNKNMPKKNKQSIESISETNDLLKKLLALELIKAGVSKENIRKKLCMNANALSTFLKGAKTIKIRTKLPKS